MRSFALLVALAPVFGLILGSPTASSAYASPAPTSSTTSSCSLALMAAAQPVGGCTWVGTITLSRSLANTSTTAVPATPNNHGGTQTSVLEEHDTTTIQVGAEGTGIATRDHTLVNTTTTHTEPGRRCAANAPLTFGTYEMITESRTTQRGSSEVPVQVTVNPGASTFEVTLGIPTPASTLDTTLKESYGGLCNTPKPTDTTQSATRPAGTVTRRSFTAAFDPTRPNVLDGSQPDSLVSGSGTISWHLEGTCDCETYRRQLAQASATLINHAATVRDLLDQISDGMPATLGESPELLGAEAELGTARLDLDTLFDGTGVLGDPSDAAVQAAGQGFADAVGGWYAGSGIFSLQQLQQVAVVPQAETGLPRVLTLDVGSRVPPLQTTIQQLAADRQAVTALQILLASCEASGGA